MDKLPKRAQAKEEYCWNMKDMYVSDDEWESHYKEIERDIEEYQSLREGADKDAGALLKLLDFNASMEEASEKIYVYANQKSHEDMAVALYQDMSQRASALLIKLEYESAYIKPLIMGLGREKIAEFMRNEKGLGLYERYFDNILRKSEHILDGDAEALLAKVSDIAQSPSDIFAMFNNADVKFPEIDDGSGNKVRITNGRYTTFLQSADRSVRKAAFKGLYGVYESYKNTLAATYRSNVKQHLFYTKIRNYDSAVAYSLDDANIPVSVYDSLIDSVKKHLPLMHRYAAVRKKMLGLDEMHMYDLYVPLVPDADKKISYDKAKEIVLAGLKPLGEEYGELLKKGFDSGWIDVYENEGKRSGAYSWGCYGVHPYVLLNHQDNLNSVFTLAHEMGHALHSYYSDSNQPYIYAGYKIFVAEVASTCNEALLVNYLIDNSTDLKERMYLINYFLEQFRTTFFRQAMFAEFERITHGMAADSKTLTAENMCDIYRSLNEEYFGEAVYIDSEIAMEWARIPHFYTPFYVYQYATGFAAAVSISSAILSGEDGVLEGYREFLKGGGSKDPIDLLKLCGVDMTESGPVDRCMETFKKLLDEFEDADSFAG